MVKNLSNISGANVILYAQWEPTQYSITYNLDGGTSNNPTTYTMETEDFSLSKPFKSGYTFLGWTGSNGETIEKTVTITKGSIGDKTYTANWDREEGIVPVIRELDTTGFSTSTVTNLVRNDNESTNFTINGVTYETVIYYFPEDVTISSTTLPDTSGVLTLGNDADVAKSSTALTASSGHMVVAIFEKNLTIESTGTITAYRYKDTDNNWYYGGPKGIYICVKGNLINDGTISMTARGANATGDNVYLYSNDATNWEYVPAAGATGGVAKSFKNTSADQSAAGASGNDGSTVANSVRATGGGGSGGVRKTNCANANYEVKSGAGGRGTSYSGGSGGGGAYLEGAGSNVTGGTGSSTGGAGGAGKGARNYTQSGTQANAGGGAGNPGANGVKINSSGTTSTYKGSDGTGGLLIIYGNEVNNIGNIESKGSNGGNTASSNNNKSVGGGASGGGSINIFYNTLYNNEGNIYVTGGTGGTKYGTGKAGGNGGAGTVTSGSLANHRYTSDV